MALYYWLGQTANGNVNLAANWTLWSPLSVTGGNAGFLPPAAPTIPKYGDNIRFSRYSGITGATFSAIYPLFAPSGQLNGLCGPAGATLVQWISTITVDDNCPVPLGHTASYFKVRAESIILSTGTNTAVGFGPQYPTYLDLLGGTGATKADASLTIFAKRDYTYYIKGNAKTIALANNNAFQSRATLQLEGLSMSGVLTDSTVATNGFDTIYIDDSTRIGGGIFLTGKGSRMYVAKGYNSRNGVINLTGYSNTEGPIVYFRAEGATGFSGPESTTKTSCALVTYSTNKNYPKIYVNHGVDFLSIAQNGGLIEFLQPPTIDITTVYSGSFNASNSKIIAPYNTLNFGSTSGILVQNEDGDVPDITITGVSSYLLTPWSTGKLASARSDALTSGGKITVSGATGAGSLLSEGII